MIRPFIKKCYIYHDLKRGWIKTLIACGMLPVRSTPPSPALCRFGCSQIGSIPCLSGGIVSGGMWMYGTASVGDPGRNKQGVHKGEEFATEEEMDRVLVLRRLEALVRTHARLLVSLKGESSC
jgi:hypothetical protein